MKKIVLASSSPRRIEMMRNNGYDPVIIPADVDEKLPFGMTPESSAMYLALKKAQYVADSLKSECAANAADHDDTDALIIAADTIVVYHNKIIGKPKNEVDAYLTLHRMKNDCHHVITGVCLIDTAKTNKICLYEDTSVFFTDYSAEELDAYVKTAEPYDKAGGYAIQGTFKKYIDHIEGDFDNVVGFPWSRIEPYLDELKYT